MQQFNSCVSIDGKDLSLNQGRPLSYWSRLRKMKL